MKEVWKRNKVFLDLHMDVLTFAGHFYLVFM